MSTAIVRPATRNDLDRLAAMIARVDLGMLTMPSSRDAMAARIERSLTAFARPSVAPQNECYFLVMEEDGELLGTASVFTNLEARGGGRGRLLSFARLMLIAADPVRFGPKAMAEIRGFTDADGNSPFWDAVGSKFFHMEYRKADSLSARDHRFIAD
jgi:arginine N-succinyltransferase